MRNFREYKVWKDAIDLSIEVYRLTENFPKHEVYALANQLQRAIVSIPSNIAEGSAKQSELDFAHFLEFALGSAYEAETQLQIAVKLGYVQQNEHDSVIMKLQSIEKRLSSLINKLRNKKI